MTNNPLDNAPEIESQIINGGSQQFSDEISNQDINIGNSTVNGHVVSSQEIKDSFITHNHITHNKSLFETIGKAEPLHKYVLILSAALLSVGITAFILIGRERLFALIEHFNNHTLTSSQFIGFILFIVTIFLGAIWIVAVLLEINWIERFYQSVMPSPPHGAVFNAALIACIITVLAYLSDNIMVYSVIYLIFCLFDMVAITMSLNTVDKVLITHETNEKSKIDPNMLFEIRLYYVRRHWLLLVLFRILGTIAAVICARMQLEIMAYSLIISMIVINELVIWSWRIRLYRKHHFVFSSK